MGEISIKHNNKNYSRLKQNEKNMEILTKLLIQNNQEYEEKIKLGNMINKIIGVKGINKDSLVKPHNKEVLGQNSQT